MVTQLFQYLQAKIFIPLLIVVILLNSCNLTPDTPTPTAPSPTAPSMDAASATPFPTATPVSPVTTTLPVCEPGENAKPAEAITITLVYEPDFAEHIEKVMRLFNCAYASGIHPINRTPLASNTLPIYVTGQEIASDSAAERLSAGDLEPTIYIPSSRLWLSLINDQQGETLFAVDDAPASALTPVVIAIWESYLQKLRENYPGEMIGWRHLLELFQAENGWQSVGGLQKTIDYGHTSPYVSSTGLAAWVMEFYAAARYCADWNAEQPLPLALVEDQQVQNCVQQIEQAIKHYSAHTVIFREYMVEGPSYVSIVPLEENDLITINEGKTRDGRKPPEKLVALYPDDGIFWSEHPLAIPNGNWISSEQRAAADQFIAFVLSKEMQALVMEYGFRPVDQSIPLMARFGPENGVDPNRPHRVPLLKPPMPTVLHAIQQQWSLIKKQADIVLLIDVSASMGKQATVTEATVTDENGVEKTVTKLQQAQLAAKTFLQEQSNGNRVSLVTFNNKVTLQHPMCILEECRHELIATIDSLTAGNDTALFDALYGTVQQLSQITDTNRIKAIVVISDGSDTASNPDLTLAQITEAIQATQATRAPVLVIPVAYAYTYEDKKTGLGTLEAIAEAARMKVLVGDVSEINELLRTIGEYF